MTSELYKWDSGQAVPPHDHSGDAGDGGTIDHGALTGKGDDDHPQYLLASGARPVSGNLQVASGNDGQVDIGGGGVGYIELGKTGRVLASTPFIDFHSSANSPDYDARIIASGGNATAGNGLLDIYAAGGLRLAGWMRLDGETGITAAIDGGGSAPSVGWKHYIPFPTKTYMHYFDAVADVAGSAVIGIYAFTAFPSTYTTIATVTFSSNQAVLGSFSTPYTFTPGQVLGIYVSSASTLTKVWITMQGVKVF